MAVDWHSSVPKKFVPDGYNESPPDNLIRSQPDIGPAKVRRRTTANTRPISGYIDMNSSELQLFDTWFVNTLASGSLTFNFPLARAGTNAEHRFISVPQYRSLGGAEWRVSMQMEIMP